MAEGLEILNDEVDDLSREGSLACDTAGNGFLPLVTMPGHDPLSRANDWHLPRRSFFIMVGLLPALALKGDPSWHFLSGPLKTAMFFRKV
jgi:hypothetical protein